MTPRRPLLSALVAVCLLGPGAGGAADGGCPDLAAPRVVALGDVHGAHEGFLSVLRFAGVADEKGQWAGGKEHLVQTGDVLDRGKDAPKVLDLLMRLEGEARKAGGRLHALLGNHEFMNVLGDLRYVNLAEYEHLRTPDSIDRRASTRPTQPFREPGGGAWPSSCPAESTGVRERPHSGGRHGADGRGPREARSAGQ